MSNKETVRFHSYALPTIQITKYVDTEAANGNVMYDLYLNGQREQRYDIKGLLYRLELMFRVAGGVSVTSQEGVIINDNQKQTLPLNEADN